MRGLILPADSAGVVGELDGSLPARLVPLAGRLLIERQIAALRGGGVTDIGVVRSYRGETINDSHVTYFENDHRGQTATAMSLVAAAAWLRAGPVIVSYADVFYPRDLVHRLGSVRGSLVVAYDRQWRDVWARRFGDDLSKMETFRRGTSGNLLEIGGTTANIDEVEGRYIGLLKFTPTAWQAVEAVLTGLETPTREQLDVKGLLQRLLAAKLIAIGTVGTDGHCGEVTSPGDATMYEAMIAAGQLLLED
jgi:choline kinase